MERSTQRDVVLRRLQRGPATSRDLAMCGVLCYTKRISELRRAGWEIVSSEKRVNGSRHVTYSLKGQRELFEGAA